MRSDEIGRDRSVLLARWRGAAVVRERSEDSAPATPREDAVSSPKAATELASSVADEAALLRRLEAEIRRAVPRTTADTLCRILAPLSSELSPEVRAAALSKLDLVEDVLDAVLLAGRGQSDEPEKEREPP